MNTEVSAMDGTDRLETITMRNNRSGETDTVPGDVRHGAVRRVASAVGQGSISVSFVQKYLETV